MQNETSKEERGGKNSTIINPMETLVISKFIVFQENSKMHKLSMAASKLKESRT